MGALFADGVGVAGEDCIDACLLGQRGGQFVDGVLAGPLPRRKEACTQLYYFRTCPQYDLAVGPQGEEASMAKVLCVLYDDPVDGYPSSYARDEIPRIASYPGGQTTPSPHAIDFTPGQLLGSVSGELGLRRFLEDAGHTLVVT